MLHRAQPRILYGIIHYLLRRPQMNSSLSVDLQQSKIQFSSSSHQTLNVDDSDRQRPPTIRLWCMNTKSEYSCPRASRLGFFEYVWIINDPTKTDTELRLQLLASRTIALAPRQRRRLVVAAQNESRSFPFSPSHTSDIQYEAAVGD